MRSLRLGIAPLALLVLSDASGCFQYEDEQDPTDTGAADGGGATPSDATTDSAADDSADGAPDATVDGPIRGYVAHTQPSCDSVPPMTRAFSPAGCTHTVNHPSGVTGASLDCSEVGVEAAPNSFRVSFPTADPSSDIAVMWRTGADTRSSLLQLGESPDDLRYTFGGHSFTYGALGARRLHEVHVCGLEAGRTWYYRVGGEGAFSEVMSFSTSPVAGSEEEIVFGVGGDTRTEDLLYSEWTEALTQMQEAGLDFLVHSGDLVDEGLVVGQWLPFFELSGPILGNLPILPTVGNHDFFDINYIANFALPNSEEHWHVRYGNVVLVSLNDFSLLDFDANLEQAAEYLRDSLEANADAEWRVVVHHRPLFSAGTRHGPAFELQDAWGPILDRYDVDLVLAGHEHNYERSRPIAFPDGADPMIATGHGTVFVVAAGLGAPLYDLGSNWWTQTSESIENYAIVTVRGSSLTLRAYRLDGTALDEFTLTH